MSFIKKLFGLSNKEEEKVEDLSDSLEEITENQDSDDDEEVVVHDTEDYEFVELSDEEEEENVVVEKSIEEIIDDVTEMQELQEKESLVEAYETFSETSKELKDNIGIFEVEEEIHVEISNNIDFNRELVEDEPVTKTIGELKEVQRVDIAVDEATDTGETVIEVNVEVENVKDENTFDEISEVTIVEEETEEPEVEETQEEAQEETPEIKEDVEEKQEKKSFFAKLKEGVKKTRDSIFGNLNTVFNMFTTIYEDLFEELEEALILADMGVDTSLHIINELRKNVKKNGITEVYQVKEALINIISEILTKDEDEFVIKPQTVILVIGVNGAGKTTTIGKLANNFKNEGHSVTVAAADTFRAAAIEQLQVWADRSGAHLIRKEEGSDPASVVFDACKSAKAKNTDVLIVDTAGRLQNKKNLMEELKKINRIIEREFPEAQREVFLVLDSTTGQNAMQQAKLFNETADITGLILTKLDGTAKGGVIVSIKNELKVPVRYVGLGEKVDDLEKFDSKQFAKAMFE